MRLSQSPSRPAAAALPDPAIPSPLGHRPEEQVRRRLVEHYYRVALKSVAFLIAVNWSLAWLVHQHYQDAASAASACLLMIVPLVRLHIAVRYRRAHSLSASCLQAPPAGSPADARRWEHYAVWPSYPIALGYLACSFFIIRPGEHACNALVGFWMLAIMSSTVAAAVTMRRIVLVFASVVGAGLALRLFLLGDEVYAILGGVSSLYAAGTLVIGLQANDMHVASLTQSVLNQDLATRLAEKVTAAEAADREKNRFLAAATHDLRQPLHAIALGAASLRESLRGTSQEGEVNRLMSALGLIDESLNAMLDLSRLDAGTLVPKFAAVPVAAIFSSLREAFGQRAEAKGLALRMHAGDHWISTDRALLTRLLSNLVDNAIKYTTDGGVLITAQRRGDLVRLCVRDSGVGIDPEHHPRIFEEFFQLGNRSRSRAGGLGLGLSIVRRLARLMGTEVQVRSGVGCGTTMEIMLPPAEPEARPAAAETRHAANLRASIRGKRILVVDNEEVIVRAMVDLLRPFEALVDAATSAGEAERLVGSALHPYDLYLLDYRLGEDTNGIDLAMRLRTHHGIQGRVVLITGDTGSQEIQNLRRSGDEVFFKPLRGDAFIDMVAATGSLVA